MLGHEMSHIANGDMVTMTLIQGVMNTFVVFLSRVIGYVVDRILLRNESDAPGIGYYMTLGLFIFVINGLLSGWWRRSSKASMSRGSGRQFSAQSFTR